MPATVSCTNRGGKEKDKHMELLMEQNTILYKDG